ncbi:MAG: hypothetical protein ACLQT6_09795 [Desulfomonilaceae bacterium]
MDRPFRNQGELKSNKMDFAASIGKLGLNMFVDPLSNVILDDHDNYRDRFARIGRLGFRKKVQTDRGPVLRALIIDHKTPEPDKDAGSSFTCQFIKALIALNVNVTFIPDDLKHAGTYTESLQRLGVKCIYEPYSPTIRSFLKRQGSDFDLVFISRAPIATKHLSDLRRLCRKAR